MFIFNIIRLIQLYTEAKTLLHMMPGAGSKDVSDTNTSTKKFHKID